MHPLGKTMLLANPVAQSGRGMRMAQEAFAQLEALMGADGVDLVMTGGPRDAITITQRLSPVYDTIITLGGDGLIHEVVNGLMLLPAEDRARMAVIPAGSGNDYARTLGMATKLEGAIEQICRQRERVFDVGRCNGEFFAETLSFGLDAAIALDTMERRKKSGRSGTMLYAASGVDQLLHHLDLHTYAGEVEMPDGEVRQIEGQSITFAVQIGGTYGGGFLICPDAQPDDGLFDICIAHPPMNLPKALMLFGRAKGGGHVGSKNIELLRVRSLRVGFAEQPPTQIDGEELIGSAFEVNMHPAAITVLVG